MRQFLGSRSIINRLLSNNLPPPNSPKTIIRNSNICQVSRLLLRHLNLLLSLVLASVEQPMQFCRTSHLTITWLLKISQQPPRRLPWHPPRLLIHKPPSRTRPPMGDWENRVHNYLTSRKDTPIPTYRIPTRFQPPIKITTPPLQGRVYRPAGWPQISDYYQCAAELDADIAAIPIRYIGRWRRMSPPCGGRERQVTGAANPVANSQAYGGARGNLATGHYGREYGNHRTIQAAARPKVHDPG